MWIVEVYGRLAYNWAQFIKFIHSTQCAHRTRYTGFKRYRQYTLVYTVYTQYTLMYTLMCTDTNSTHTWYVHANVHAKVHTVHPNVYRYKQYTHRLMCTVHPVHTVHTVHTLHAVRLLRWACNLTLARTRLARYRAMKQIHHQPRERDRRLLEVYIYTTWKCINFCGMSTKIYI